MTRKLYRIAPLLGLVAIVLTAALAFASQALEDALSEKELETVVHYITNEVLATGRMDFTGETNYPIWVHSEDSLGDLAGSHLVPTYFLVDADGRVLEKLIGDKSRDAAIAERVSVHLERTSRPHRRGHEACCVKRFSFF